MSRTSPSPAWVERATCRGGAAAEFVPDTDSVGNRRRRLADPPDRVVMLCAPCPVHIDCLRDGLRSRANGWWGGVLLHGGKIVHPDGHVTVSRRSPQRAAAGESMVYFRAEFARHTDECQVWPFGRSLGYGVVEWDGRSTGVHVVSCTLAHGPRPAGLWVRHRCEERACFNRRHVYWGPAPILEHRWASTARGGNDGPGD